MTFKGNPEHLAKLMEGVESWNKWRVKNPELVPNLRIANLSDADLSDADLSRADLSETDLCGANLSNADLIESNVSDAYLIDADLSGAKLSGAKLSGANLWETVLANVNLSKTNGLDNVNHEGPSFIDHSTLALSGELIPLIFCQGGGLPDWMIEGAEANIHSAIRFYSCFISYSNKEEDFAIRLHADLQGKGVRCWFAPEDLKIGDKVRDVIEDAIRLHDKLILILSETSIENDWVEHEVSKALEREEKDGSLVLFPIRMDRAVMSAEFGWAKAIREAHKPTGRHIGNFTNWKEHDRYQVAFDRLMRDLRIDE